MKKKEYGMSQKGLDAIDRIIKESPQYKALIEEFLKDLKRYPHNRTITIKDLIKKWEKEVKRLEK